MKDIWNSEKSNNILSQIIADETQSGANESTKANHAEKDICVNLCFSFLKNIATVPSKEHYWMKLAMFYHQQ